MAVAPSPLWGEGGGEGRGCRWGRGLPSPQPSARPKNTGRSCRHLLPVLAPGCGDTVGVPTGDVDRFAAALVPAEMKALDCGSPENFARQVAVDNEWYAQHYATILARYMDAIAS